MSSFQFFSFHFYLRVTVTGIYRATPLRVNPRMRNVKAVYKTYIDVIHFRKTDKRKLHERDSDRYFCIFEAWLLAATRDQFLFVFLYFRPCQTALMKLFCENSYSVGIYLLKVNNRITRTRCKICSKLTVKTPE